MQQNSNVCISTGRKRSWGKVMFLHVFVILFTGGRWYPSMHCRWYPSMPCSRSRGWYPSMPCRSPGPYPGGKLRGLARGVSRPTPRGVSQHALGQTPPHTHMATAAGGTHPTGMHSCFLQMIASSNSLCGEWTESVDSENDCIYIKFNT